MPDDDAPVPPKPPNAPPFRRRLALTPAQFISLTLLMLMPALALFGVFGPAEAEASTADGGLRLHVLYPTRLRYLMISSFQISVENTAAQTHPRVVVRFDRQLVEAFAEVAFTPAPQTVTAEAFEVELSDLRPGETRHVLISLRADEYWGHSGLISAQAGDAAPVSLTAQAFVIP